jgi:DNA repair protein RadC
MVRANGDPDKTYTVTTRLRTFTFALSPADRPFLGHARGAAQVARLARALIPRDGREHFGMFFLNSNLDVLGYHELAIGTLEAALISPREVYGAALRVLGTASIIVVHNHPSGNPEPSRHDIALTRRLARAGALLDVELIDHVIIGAPGHVSLVAKGVIGVS